MTLPGITTVYNGVAYRSRTEARWAVFFDRIGWMHTYEPFDGHFYLVDFMIHGSNRFVVETRGTAANDNDFEHVFGVTMRGLADVSSHDVLILGCDPLPDLHATGHFWPAGLLWDARAARLDTAVWYRCGFCNGFAIMQYEAPLTESRPCGCPLIDTYDLGLLDSDEIRKHWAVAINTTKRLPQR